MTIAFRAATAPSTTGGTADPVAAIALPTGTQAGDLVILALWFKYSTSTIASTPSGWTAPANSETTGGAGASGIDAGVGRIALFTRVYDGVWTMPTIDLSAAPNISMLGAVSYSKAAGESWAAVVCGAISDTSGSTTQYDPPVFGTTIDFGAGDFVGHFTGFNGDAPAVTSVTMGVTGVVFGSNTQRWNVASATGQDSRTLLYDRSYTSGTASTGPDILMDYTGGTTNTAGATVFYRLRVTTVTAIGKELQSIWDTRAAIGDTVQAVWDTRAAIADSLQTVWDIRTAVGDTLQSIWDVRQALGDTLEARWDVRAALGDSLQTVWDVRSAVGDTAQLVWNVESLAAAVGKALGLIWSARAALGDSLELPWNVRAVLGDTLEARWNVNQLAFDSLQLVWDVRSAVGDSTQLVWHVRTIAGDNLELVWNLRATVGKDGALVWNVESLVIIITPAERIVRVSAEARALIVTENRSIIVPAENRTVTGGH